MSFVPNIISHSPQVTLANFIVPSEVLFVAEDSPWGRLGYETVAAYFRDVQPVFWSPGSPKPDLSQWRGDWIISFKADLILSSSVLESAQKGAINFHPCPPKYRGVGGYWWALQNRDDVFGVTCHHMDKRIDHGAIIATESFPIWPEETEASLKHRAAIHALSLLQKTLNVISSGKSLAVSEEEWGQHLYTYQELENAKRFLAISSERHSTLSISKLADTKLAFEALEAVLQEDQEIAPENMAAATVSGDVRAA